MLVFVLQCIGAVFLLFNSGCTGSQPVASTPPTASPSPQPTLLIPSPVPSPTPTPARLVPTVVPLQTALSMQAKTAALLPSPSPSACPDGVCLQDGHFLLSYPLPPEAQSGVDATYRYGFTQAGKRPLHHGVDLKAALDTAVLAAADGVVVVAGNDSQIVYGLKNDFYGNLVILEHKFPGVPTPVYTLYGHLSDVIARNGLRVRRGQEIGRVGMTGVAIGYHVHFEVRQGSNSYDSTRNPELWLIPPLDEKGEQSGVFAGRITDEHGQPMRIAKVVLDGEEPGDGAPVYLNTYDDPPIPHKTGSRDDSFLMPYTSKTLGREDDWQEDFCLGGLPPGKYRFSFTSQIVFNQIVEIKPGKLTFITVKTNY